MGGQFKDASAQNGCRAIHLLLEKTTGCQVPLNIHPSIRPSIHPSIYLSLYLSISLQDPPNRGGRRHQGASPFYNIYIYINHIYIYKMYVVYCSIVQATIWTCKDSNRMIWAHKGILSLLVELLGLGWIVGSSNLDALKHYKQSRSISSDLAAV